jgi:hypothetical protein
MFNDFCHSDFCTETSNDAFRHFLNQLINLIYSVIQTTGISFSLSSGVSIVFLGVFSIEDSLKLCYEIIFAVPAVLPIVFCIFDLWI